MLKLNFDCARLEPTKLGHHTAFHSNEPLGCYKSSSLGTSLKQPRSTTLALLIRYTSD